MHAGIIRIGVFHLDKFGYGRAIGSYFDLKLIFSCDIRVRGDMHHRRRFKGGDAKRRFIRKSIEFGRSRASRTSDFNAHMIIDARQQTRQ